jgi:hypothetical protein
MMPLLCVFRFSQWLCITWQSSFEFIWHLKNPHPLIKDHQIPYYYPLSYYVILQFVLYYFVIVQSRGIFFFIVNIYSIIYYYLMLFSHGVLICTVHVNFLLCYAAYHKISCTTITTAYPVSILHPSNHNFQQDMMKHKTLQ